MDEYDLEIERITKEITEGNSKAISEAWFKGECLFKFASKSGNPDLLHRFGCLTIIRNYPNTYYAETKALTEEISKDERIPKNASSITVKDLPVFAEWQRRLDKELNRK